MMKVLAILLLPISIISCEENKIEQKRMPADSDSDIAKQLPSLDQIAFNFSAKKDVNHKGYLKIHAILSNDNIDTVYLYTRSDHGLQYSLLYDTAKFQYKPESIANISYPIVVAIPPGGQLDFAAPFLLKRQESKVRLDYDFFRLEKRPNMDLQIVNPDKISNFERRRQMTILQGSERTIE